MDALARAAEKEFGAYFEAAMLQPLPDLVKREPKLRVSGFPFCGLKSAYNKLTHHVEPDEAAGKDFYCGVGTVAHEVFQRYTGAYGRVYGDWECLNKQCKHVVHFSKSNKCPKCKSEMRYEEFTVYLFQHVSGHTDGLFKDRKGRFWVIDYKTSSVRVLDNQKLERTLPYSKNVAQISAYVVMLAETFSIHIEGWLLIYIARDNPRAFKVCGATMSEEEKEATYQTIYKYDRQYDRVLKLKSKKQLDYLVRNKLCRDRNHYLADVKGFKACPLEAVCFGKQLQPLLDIVLEEYLETETVKNH